MFNAAGWVWNMNHVVGYVRSATTHLHGIWEHFPIHHHTKHACVSVCGVRINYFSTSSLNAFEKLTCALWNCFDLRPGPMECICELLCIANVMYWGTTRVSLRVSRWNHDYSECFPRECVTTSIFHRLLANGKSSRKGGGFASFSISKHLQ